jgi:hypothetical protein
VAGNVYGSPPDLDCSGDDPGPETPEETTRRHARPCDCMTREDYDERQHACSIMQ